MFFHYSQNNSGGGYDTDRDRGIYSTVIIEADSSLEADEKAESIGLYFDGRGDCPCCGNRWSPVFEDGTEEPESYGRALIECDDPWQDEGRSDHAFIHYADGRVVWARIETRKP